MVFIRDNKQPNLTSRKTAPLFVCAKMVRLYMNIVEGIMDKEIAP